MMDPGLLKSENGSTLEIFCLKRSLLLWLASVDLCYGLMNQKISVSRIKTAVSFSCLFIITIVIASIFGICRIFNLPGRPAMAKLFHKSVLKCFNLEVLTEGQLITGRPTLYISNHISYIDIFVLGSVVPGTYIAKSEVASWPLFGTLAKLQNTLFIERRSAKVGNQIAQIQRYLLNVGNLILFPEGTSSYGTYVAPFHSSFFQSASSEADDIVIQAITVAYTHYKGQRMDRQARDFYSWYKPRKILPHFLNALGLGKAQVKLTFHEPIKFSQFESRKECSKHCESVIRQGLLNALDMKEELIE